MAVFLDQMTSLGYFRELRLSRADESLRVDDRRVEAVPALRRSSPDDIAASHVPSSDELELLLDTMPQELADPMRRCLPFTALVDRDAKRRRRNRLIGGVTAQPAPPPDGAFLELFPGMWVCSPEYALVRYASLVPMGTWLLDAMALCGVHEIEPGSDGSIRRVRPITAAQSVQDMCERAGGVRGAKSARRWAQLLMDGSASPQESRAALLFSLPLRLGGYGLPRPTLNTGLGTTRPPRASGGSPLQPATAVPDLSWVDQRVVLEYLSNEWHASSGGLAHDARRANRITARGIAVLSLTNEQLGSIGDTDQMARDLARLLGARLRRRGFTDEWRDKNLQLRAELGLRVDRSDFDGWTRTETDGTRTGA